ncbi:MAG TPA: dihydrolipoamide acetyltransferase family protein [Actinomycetota bacterium]|nr:dihydrolipoamide acetyltransferase family protein [Actinomycetota bacterium]
MSSRDFKLPDLGEGLEDAEVVRWLVNEGDQVTLNQPLVEVDTAKALVEIPSPIAGSITRLHANAGDTVMVGATLVTFEVSGQETSGQQTKRKAVLVGYGVDESSPTGRRRRLNVPSKPSPKITEAKDPVQSPGPVSAAPPIRKLAAELNVDLRQITGTGPQGRINREDVLAASTPGAPEDVGSTPAAMQGDQRIPVKGPRKLIAQKMIRSVSEIPHVTTYLSVDTSEVLRARDAVRTRGGEASPLSIIARGFVEICKAHPRLNSTWSNDEIILRGEINLGIATDTDRGLVVPVIKQADERSVEDMTKEIARLATLARDGKITPDDLFGGTVTISNVGSFGAEFGTPIINHPECCILAIGVIEERAVVIDGEIQVRPITTLSLSFDHRILDGAEAGRALKDLQTLLQDDQWSGAI